MNSFSWTDPDNSTKNKLVNLKNNNNDNDLKTMGLESKYGVGAKLLMKMGYVAGNGLGKHSDGIVTPVETVKRVKGVGLGMFTAKNDYLEGESESESESESDEELIIHGIEFKSGEVLKSAHEQEFEHIKSKLKELKVSNERLENINSIIELKSLYFKLNTLKNRITKFEQQESQELQNKAVITKKKEILQRIKNIDILDELYNQKLITDIIITEVFTPWQKDDLLLYIFNMMLSNDKANIHELDYLLYPNNQILKFMNHCLNCKNIEDGNMLKLQTKLYQLLSPTIEDILKKFLTTKSNKEISLVITLLLDYENVLKFISTTGNHTGNYCYYNYLVNKYITPRIRDVIFREWNILEDTYTLSTWFKDFQIIIPEAQYSILSDTIVDKFVAYLDNWYHRDPLLPTQVLELIENVCASGSNNINVAKILNEHKFIENKFLKQVYRKYFDLNADLLNDEKLSLYFFAKLKECQPILKYGDFYDLIIYHCLNEIAQYAYIWFIYQGEDFYDKGVTWCKWILDLVPDDIDVKNENKLKEIHLWLANPSVDKIIYSEQLNFEGLSLLNTSNTNTTSTTEYNIENIPLIRIKPTFKEVVEDYCEEHGRILQRSTETYFFRENHGGTSSTKMYPLYYITSFTNTTTSKKKRIKCFISNNDCLWINYDQDPDHYKKVFLYELESDFF
ncbi:uncharacterized protein SCODWIG_01133 [Saccharomycodes ludwigii]|uniref:G-patch domain-containing protein n=1 Tax=Saccharomycodes ludwigii TaxID=36035 RepID=A0A376B431_9ASCO|nr:hypothetical protein SCDLUD_004308 [Saccharomycodes ludwigii]KAH3899991.1 hypothetical protein SCDLUD_004308 [Saccharomycodes ludwigii]SSD59372.1 uncharacterized protein SCODWIG_01133 [Saccharomycodes ludwigii]